MPFKSEKIKLPRSLDRRVKYTEEDKKRIADLYKEGYSMYRIAQLIPCSKRYVHFILFPEKLERVRELFAERRLDGRYYIKEKHTEAMKSTRRYKQDLYKKGII